MRETPGHCVWRTFADLGTQTRLASHEVPHPDRPVLPDAQRELAGRVDGHAVNPTLVSLERPQRDPVSRGEEGERPILGRGE